MKALHYPDYSRDNPYQALMLESLRENGCEAEAFNGRVKAVWARSIHDDADILHLHWISSHAISASVPRSIANMLAFYACLLVWRVRGKKIVWTVHNLGNHERKRPWLDNFHARIVGRLAHRILVHAESISFLVSDELGVPDQKINVLHHGNYVGKLKGTKVDRVHQGRRFLFFGQIRPYKGVSDLLRAFARVDGPHELLVMGRTSMDLHQEIKDLSSGDRRISLNLEFVSDDKLEKALSWSDVVVLPYKDIFSSGSLLMALTAGRPVIAPALGIIPEYVGPEASYLYDSSEPDGLLSALKAAVEDEDIANKSMSAFSTVEQFGWKEITQNLISIYRDVRSS